MVEYDIMLSKVNIGGVSGLISRLDEISCVKGALGSEMSVLTSDNHASRGTTGTPQPSGSQSARGSKERVIWHKTGSGRTPAPVRGATLANRAHRGPADWRGLADPVFVGVRPGLAPGEARYSSWRGETFQTAKRSTPHDAG